MNNQKIINFNFIKQYTKFPGGRFIRLGEFSGEDFRENILREVFELNKRIEIDATGVVTSFSPSFLDEAFGKLAKEYGLKKFNETVDIFSNDNPKLKDKMMYYVNRAIDVQ